MFIPTHSLFSSYLRDAEVSDPSCQGMTWGPCSPEPMRAPHERKTAKGCKCANGWSVKIGEAQQSTRSFFWGETLKHYFFLKDFGKDLFLMERIWRSWKLGGLKDFGGIFVSPKIRERILFDECFLNGMKSSSRYEWWDITVKFCTYELFGASDLNVSPGICRIGALHCVVAHSAHENVEWTDGRVSAITSMLMWMWDSLAFFPRSTHSLHCWKLWFSQKRKAKTKQCR